MNQDNEIHKEVLDNGLEVIIDRRPNRKVTGMEMMVKTGSNHQENGNRGIMHLIEHLLGNGSEKYPEKGQAMEEITKLGGELNMATDVTDVTVPGLVSSKHQDKLLELIIDITFRSKLKHIEEEKKIIKNEIEESKDDDEDRANKRLNKAMYENDYLFDLLGSIENVNSIEEEEIKDIYREVFHPNNASISIAGPVNKQKILNDVEKLTNDLGKGKKPHIEDLKPLNNSKEIQEHEERTQTYMKMATDLPNEQRYSELHWKIKLTENILGLVPDLNLLYNKLREENQLVYDVIGFARERMKSSRMFIETSFDPKNEEKARKLVKESIEEINQEVTGEELEDYKSHIKGYNRVEEDNIRDRTRLLNQYNLHNSLDAFKKRNKKIDQVALEEIKEFSRENLKPSGFYTYLLEPKNASNHE